MSERRFVRNPIIARQREAAAEQVKQAERAFVRRQADAQMNGLLSEGQIKHLDAVERVGRAPLDRSTYRTVGSDGSPESTIILYPDMLVIEPGGGPGPQVGGGARGDVRGKSRSSRRRQMSLMAQIRPSGRLYFVGLTYSDDFVLDWAVWKRDLKVFAQRLLRLWPDAWCLWALEFQERKSGERVMRDANGEIVKGQLAPHFHLIVGGVNPVDLGAEWFDAHLTARDKDKSELELRLQGWAKQNWYEVNHVNDPAAVRRGADVVELDSRRKIYSYVAKYTGKEQDGYVHDIETGEIVGTGRMWGKRGDIPVHPGKRVRASEGEIINLKRLVKRWLKARGQKSGQWYGKWVVQHSTGKKVVLFGWGLDAFNGLPPPETDDYVQPDKQADLDAFVRFVDLLEMCGDVHHDSDYARFIRRVRELALRGIVCPWCGEVDQVQRLNGLVKNGDEYELLYCCEGCDSDFSPVDVPPPDWEI